MELLLHWMRKWNISDEMLWKKSAINQAVFIRDTICQHLLHTHAFAVSCHTSKSILLPVYAFTMRNGIKVICRENFYGWKLTVELPQDKPHANIIPEDLFDGGYGRENHSCYFEGFKDSWVYDGYDPDDLTQRKFSFGIDNDYGFYTVMYMLKNLYPEIDYSEESNNITKEIVMDTIKKIYNSFGFNEQYVEDKREKHLMYGWEIMMYTSHQLSNYYFQKKYNIEYIPYDIADNIEDFAEEVVKYPETRKMFITESKMYNTNF